MGYLFAAYTIFWTVMAGYLLFLIRKTNRAEAEIERLKRQLALMHPGANPPGDSQPMAR